MEINVMVADESHTGFAEEICEEIYTSSLERKTGIAKRTPEYICEKIRAGKAVIAVSEDGRFAGFSYIESWGGKSFVANSGLIVSPEFRGMGLAKAIKHRAFELSRTKFPDAKIFGITTGLAVMKINTEMGYRPVTFSELTDDPEYWKECEACINFDVLKRNNYTRCLCTGMLYDPAEHVGNEMPWKKKEEAKESKIEKWKNALRKIFSLPIANGTYKGKNKDIEH